ncbi:DUF4190 domain-containing protein [Ornithinimicrobium tianjinense]|uniref:DUF4190 domain-containing protein n=1 Tax=Ornithinimicrobium tianjinense TaxID=1195761 RepID=A0A917F787_9MICO|nr:DUF4190 domain-containing protein [Ornithinimicrobium tianjinense]GGF57309.1 hypothetical protein GCM10011366_26470 [Ornithinimicrobium tianjinense]
MSSVQPPPLPGQGTGREPDNPYTPAPQAAWGAPAAYTTHPKGATVLVLGILGVTVLPFLGPFAWAMSRRALREADASPVPVANRSSLQAGLILGIIGTAFLVLGALWFGAMVMLLVTMGAGMMG